MSQQRKAQSLHFLNNKEENIASTLPVQEDLDCNATASRRRDGQDFATFASRKKTRISYNFYT